MIYIYNTVTDSILRLNDSIVIDSEKIESLENLHKMELQNNYGKIIINKETLLPEYVDNKIIIAINKNTNNFNNNISKEDYDRLVIEIQNAQAVTNEFIRQNVRDYDCMEYTNNESYSKVRSL